MCEHVNDSTAHRTTSIEMRSQLRSPHNGRLPCNHESVAHATVNLRRAYRLSSWRIIMTKARHFIADLSAVEKRLCLAIWSRRLCDRFLDRDTIRRFLRHRATQMTAPIGRAGLILPSVDDFSAAFLPIQRRGDVSHRAFWLRAPHDCRFFNMRDTRPCLPIPCQSTTLHRQHRAVASTCRRFHNIFLSMIARSHSSLASPRNSTLY